MTAELVKEFLTNLPKPKEWREGQFVYNTLYKIDGAAVLITKYAYTTDCFYNDDKIDDFIKYWTKIINDYEQLFKHLRSSKGF